VQLFVERAQAVAPAFTVTNENALPSREFASVSTASARDQPAASRIKLLPPQALLTRSAGGSTSLAAVRARPTGAPADACPLDWSFDLCRRKSSGRPARLSVFAGGFRLDAAEEVCGCDIDGVEALLENSLLRPRAGGRRPRFFMLESTGDYAFERLERDQEADGSPRTLVCGVAEAGPVERLTGKLLFSWGPEDEEHDWVIRAALGWAQRDRGDIDLELQFAASAGLFYWPNRGHLSGAGGGSTCSRARPARIDAVGLGARSRIAARVASGGDERCEGPPPRRSSRGFRRPGARTGAHVEGIAADYRGDTGGVGYYEAFRGDLSRLGHRAALEAILSNRGYAISSLGISSRPSADSARSRTRARAGQAARSRQPRACSGAARSARGSRARFQEALVGAMTTDPTEVAYGFEGPRLAAARKRRSAGSAPVGRVGRNSRATGYVLAKAERAFHDEPQEARGRLGEADFDHALDGVVGSPSTLRLV
jgi:hypothetical protein